MKLICLHYATADSSSTSQNSTARLPERFVPLRLVISLLKYFASTRNEWGLYHYVLLLASWNALLQQGMSIKKESDLYPMMCFTLIVSCFIRVKLIIEEIEREEAALREDLYSADRKFAEYYNVWGKTC